MSADKKHWWLTFDDLPHYRWEEDSMTAIQFPDNYLDIVVEYLERPFQATYFVESVKPDKGVAYVRSGQDLIPYRVERINDSWFCPDNNGWLFQFNGTWHIIVEME